MKNTLIIAEAGVNHNGDLSIAHKLIDAAANVGADIIKFQTFKASLITTKEVKKANYQVKNSPIEETQQEMLKKLELSFNDHEELIKHCNELNIEFLSTAFDLESINLLKKLQLKRVKIPSGEINNLPYLREIGTLNKPFIISSGMANLEDIKNAINEINRNLKKDITVLHCSSEYPADKKNVNLNAMKTIKRTFNLDVGYSDHTEGIEIAIAAAALGAKVIEKHLTLDKELEGPDHKASIEPIEFQNMVRSIRNVDRALGNGIKIPTQNEIENSVLVRKSIVAATNISKGEIFSKNNLTIKRPGNGISPMEWDNLIGKKASYDFETDELIKW